LSTSSGVFLSQAKESVDPTDPIIDTSIAVAKIAAILTGYIAGSTLFFLGAATIVLWIPTIVPILIFIGVVNGCLGLCIETIVSTLGLASAMVVGGIIIYSITVENGEI